MCTIIKEMNIGFWNINRKSFQDIGSFIVDLLKNKDLDVLLLSEICSLNLNELGDCLPKNYSIIKNSGTCEKVLAIAKTSFCYSSKTEGKRYIVLQSSLFDLTIIGLHLSDRRNYPEPITRINELNDILESIRYIGCNNYALVGDFNCSPFDDELTYSSGVHSILFKKEMENNEKGGIKHYNPMLFALKEHNQTYGSFRFIHNEFPLYWYAFDQVIVSKPLIDSICDIEYLKCVNGKTLLSQSGVNPAISDHLPLVFKIGEKQNDR